MSASGLLPDAAAATSRSHRTQVSSNASESNDSLQRIEKDTIDAPRDASPASVAPFSSQHVMTNAPPAAVTAAEASHDHRDRVVSDSLSLDAPASVLLADRDKKRVLVDRYANGLRKIAFLRQIGVLENGGDVETETALDAWLARGESVRALIGALFRVGPHEQELASALGRACNDEFVRLIVADELLDNDPLPLQSTPRRASWDTPVANNQALPGATTSDVQSTRLSKSLKLSTTRLSQQTATEAER